MPAFGPYVRSTTVDDEAQVHVAQRTKDNYEIDDYDIADGEWALWLPHDCDSWIIAHGDPAHVIAEGRKMIESLEAAIKHLEDHAL